MRLIGITGGVGAGKTEILSYIRKHYLCKICLADEVAHNIEQPGQECYFIHSYEAKPAAEEYRLADTVYGGRKVCAVAQKGCVIGTQFHPEKSGPVGLGIIKAYLDLCAQAE